MTYLRHVAEVHDVGAAGEVLAHVDRLLAARPGLLDDDLTLKADMGHSDISNRVMSI